MRPIISLTLSMCLFASQVFAESTSRIEDLSQRGSSDLLLKAGQNGITLKTESGNTITLEDLRKIGQSENGGSLKLVSPSGKEVPLNVKISGGMTEDSPIGVKLKSGDTVQTFEIDPSKDATEQVANFKANSKIFSKQILANGDSLDDVEDKIFNRSIYLTVQYIILAIFAIGIPAILIFSPASTAIPQAAYFFVLFLLGCYLAFNILSPNLKALERAKYQLEDGRVQASTNPDLY